MKRKLLFHLRKRAWLSLQFFDAVGQEVFNTKIEAKVGINEVKITNEMLFQQGVYFYRVEAHDFSAVKKMSFIK